MDTQSKGIIKREQIAWAKCHGICLVKGGPATKEEPLYVQRLEQNFFEPLSPETVREYEQGDGGPLRGKNGRMPKLHATHSSDAIAANVFDYWRMRDPSRVACYLDMGTHRPTSPSIHFEKKFRILPGGGTCPNVDVAIRHENGRCCDWMGIESKFIEIYPAKRQKLFDAKYFGPQVCWCGLGATRKLAETFRGNGKKYQTHKTHLDRGQLIKHLLGMRQCYARQSAHAPHLRLVYLWYNVGTEESRKHQQEVECFAGVLKEDGVYFQAMTWQELILRIVDGERTNHCAYVKYLVDRYLMTNAVPPT